MPICHLAGIPGNYFGIVIGQLLQQSKSGYCLAKMKTTEALRIHRNNHAAKT